LSPQESAAVTESGVMVESPADGAAQDADGQSPEAES
jgi:hypothetical protein